MIGPCPQSCPDRHPGCHSSCESYISWRRERDAAREEDHKSLPAFNFLTDSRTKLKKRQHQTRRK